MRYRFMLAAAIVSACGMLAGQATAQQVEAEEFVLDNGMKFLLVPRDDQPNTIAAGWVAKVGSVNERPGITGISHFFEHMMFKGTNTIGTNDAEADAAIREKQTQLKNEILRLTWTEQYDRYFAGEIDDPWDASNDTEELAELRAELRNLMEQQRDLIVKDEFSRHYRENGATGLNAFTSHDVTFYIVRIPSNKLELWTWLESDRLTDSVFREFFAERDVVHEERRLRLENTPTGELSEQFDALFWNSSPYQWSVIGYPSDLNSYSMEEALRYFNIYYRPNNLVGVLVGDFDPAHAKELIRSYFGRLERGQIEPPPVVTLEMEQIAEKRMIGECDCQPQIEVRYQGVPAGHADSYPLEVLASIMNGRTGRLYKNMIEGAEIASSARCGQDNRKYGGMFAFSAETKGEATPQDLEAAWYQEVEKLQNELVTENELQKVKNNIAADAHRRLRNNFSLMIQLGMYENIGDWELINEEPERLQAVTREDIKRVANEYFKKEKRTVGIFTRKAGTEASDEIKLADLPEEAQPMVQQMLDQMPDRPLDQLTQMLTMFKSMSEQMADQMSEDDKLVQQFVIQELEKHIAEREPAGGN